MDMLERHPNQVSITEDVHVISFSFTIHATRGKIRMVDGKQQMLSKNQEQTPWNT
jgi:hypothetical protein